MSTVNSGTKGVSGMLSFTSGTTSSGSSGSFTVGTGTATNGKGGDMIHLVQRILVAYNRNWWSKHMYLEVQVAGISTGYGRPTSSGALIVSTYNSGTKGVSGMLSFTSGTTSSGSSGSTMLVPVRQQMVKVVI